MARNTRKCGYKRGEYGPMGGQRTRGQEKRYMRGHESLWISKARRHRRQRAGDRDKAAKSRCLSFVAKNCPPPSQVNRPQKYPNDILPVFHTRRAEMSRQAEEAGPKPNEDHKQLNHSARHGDTDKVIGELYGDLRQVSQIAQSDRKDLHSRIGKLSVRFVRFGVLCSCRYISFY